MWLQQVTVGLGETARQLHCQTTLQLCRRGCSMQSAQGGLQMLGAPGSGLQMPEKGAQGGLQVQRAALGELQVLGAPGKGLQMPEKGALDGLQLKRMAGGELLEAADHGGPQI